MLVLEESVVAWDEGDCSPKELGTGPADCTASALIHGKSRPSALSHFWMRTPLPSCKQESFRSVNRNSEQQMRRGHDRKQAKRTLSRWTLWHRQGPLASFVLAGAVGISPLKNSLALSNRNAHRGRAPAVLQVILNSKRQIFCTLFILVRGWELRRT